MKLKLLLLSCLIYSSLFASVKLDSVIVINSGIAGNTTKNLLLRLHKDCLAYKPDLTILMIGTNDMVKGKSLTLEQYKKNLTALVDTIQQAGSKVLLMTILPFYEPYLLSRHSSESFQPEGPKGKRIEINKIIEQIAHDKNTYLLDVGNVFENIGQVGEDANSLIRNQQNSGHTDGVHPTATGYRFLALAVSMFVIDHNLSAHTIVCFGDSITKGDGSVDKVSYPAYLKTLLNN
ncbi:MAG: SGNH/GDSL hydrolase family protein [Chitinophagaceae bacterium]